MTLSQAVDRYLREPPPLQRLRIKSKPPAGYVRYGPKDALEAIAEYMQADETPKLTLPRVDVAPSTEQLSVKARQNLEQLDDALYLYSEDPVERRALKGHG